MYFKVGLLIQFINENKDSLFLWFVYAYKSLYFSSDSNTSPKTLYCTI